jgi:transposase
MLPNIPVKARPLSVDNNWIENQIRPIAIGRNNWLFAAARHMLRAGQR